MSYCRDCGEFAGPEDWRKRCRPCFAAAKKRERAADKAKIKTLERTVADLSKAVQLPLHGV